MIGAKNSVLTNEGLYCHKSISKTHGWTRRNWFYEFTIGLWAYYTDHSTSQRFEATWHYKAMAREKKEWKIHCLKSWFMHFKGQYDLYNLKAQGEVFLCWWEHSLESKNSSTAEMPSTWLLMAMLSTVNFYNVKEGS